MSKRKLSSKYKLTTRTVPDVMKRLEEFVRTAGLDYDRKFATGSGERRASIEHTIPMAILYFLDRPFGEQLALYDKYRPIYEEMVRKFEESEEGGNPPPESKPLKPPKPRKS